MQRELSARVKECVDLSAPGPHVFILVLQPENFSEEDRNKVKYILGMFSYEAIKYTIVLTIVRSARHVSESFTVRREDSFGLIIKECEMRHHMFDTIDRFDQNQVVKLFEKVDSMMERNGGHYLTYEKTEIMPGTSLHPGGKPLEGIEREDDLAEDGERQKKRREVLTETAVIEHALGVMVQVQNNLEEKFKQRDRSSATLIDYIRTSIQDLQKKPTQKTIFGVFGQTGCGKSSLLNAILGESELLPTGTLEACTSVIIQVEAKTEDNNYRATIDFISKEEWHKELKCLVDYLAEPNEERNEDICKMAADKIKALYGPKSSKSFKELISHTEIADLLRLGTKSFSHPEASALCKEIRPYVRHREVDFGKLYWPIVKAVKIEVPKQKELPENIVLVDLPGTGDYNQTRDEMWKQMLRDCTAVWIVSEINRAASEKAAWEILDRNMTDMVQGGECTSIAFICTKTDDLEARSYMRSEELTDEDLQVTDGNNSERKRKCIQHRNNMAKDRVEKKANEKYGTTPSVFTVSSREFLSEERLLEPKDTGIPALREELKSFHDRYTNKVATQYFSSAIGILHLIQAPREMNIDRSKLHRELTKKLEDELRSLRLNRSSLFCNLDKSLSVGVEKAAEKCVEITSEQVKVPPGKDGRGYHQTLSALCRNNGYFRSNDGETRDLNKALAAVMQNSINKEFNNLFPNKGKTGQSVQENINKFSICSININEGYSKPEAMTHILSFLKAKEAKLKEKAHEDIVKTKKDMYSSIEDTVREEMTPGYIKADEKIGTRSMTGKMKVLQEHVESLKYDMFNKGKDKMLDLFNKLMDRIESDFKETLKEAMAHALSESYSTFSMGKLGYPQILICSALHCYVQDPILIAMSCKFTF
ncbi:hypothetical protein ACEWY4_000838 [Coilia grayii]|uniref:Nuclear GTPase SLIP-GC n=1 Tax=Coilia grayii TaxID=363190 RepID=A0ABD1KXV7_9TELE